jgi:hypothetical protein
VHLTCSEVVARELASRHSTVAPSAPVTGAHPRAGRVPRLADVAHFAGTGDSFTAAADGKSVDYLGGAWTLSDPTLLRAVGVVWALVGAAFVVGAAIAWLRRPEWPRVLAGVSAVSLLVVVISLWASAVGVVIDVALLALAIRAGALSGTRGHR